jgi:hypothetical protein
MTDVDLDFVAHQNERILTEMHSMRDEMGGMRDEIRALSALMFRLDSSAKS